MQNLRNINPNELHKISIIIPVYNVKDFLNNALDSIINQTYKNIEIIIIDDGSNDGSELICEHYAKIDSRIKLFHQKNMGLSAARNKGLDNMTGDFVAFLDSDDLYLPDMINKLYSKIIETRTDCVICDYSVKNKKNYINANDIKLNNHNLNLQENVYNKEEVLSYFIENKINSSVWNKLYKKHLWDKIRFPVGHVHEDTVPLFKVLNLINNAYVSNEILLIHRINKNSITHTFSVKNIEDSYLSMKKLEELIINKMPNLFTDKQYFNKCKKNLFTIIYLHLQTILSNSKEKKEITKLLKEYFLTINKKVTKKDFNLKEKLIYFMYCNFLYSLSAIYKIYSLKQALIWSL